MRLPETQIRDAILHPDKLVRQDARVYFTDCFSRDIEVLPRAIQALETYGRRKAFQYFPDLDHLAQTEATVEWAIRELQQANDTGEVDETYRSALSCLLCSADPQLVGPRADRIVRSPGFPEDLAYEFQERLELASWEADRCWQELEKIAAEGTRGEDVDWYHAGRVVEALARQGDRYADRVLELLAQEVRDDDADPMAWLEIFLVQLAGDMRLERAVPLVVKKLYEEGDFILEESVEALAKIGSGAAAAAVAEGWLEASWDYRLFATSALGAIHSDTTVQKCLELLPRDKDGDIRTKLAGALLSQYADEGIEPVRQMVERRAYDSTTSDLMGKLVAVSTVLGVTFPEYPVWKRHAE
jgi:hypothetical protein